MDNSIETEESLLNNEQFLAWVSGKKNAASAEWITWMKSNPKYEGIVQDAVTMYRSLKITETVVPATVIFNEKERLMKHLSTSSKPTGKMIPFKKWLSIAAILTLVITGYWFWKNNQQEREIITSYGERKEITLPDGTVIMLNSNSLIKFHPDINTQHKREVFIKGEAFFKVEKTADKRPFVVRANNFDIAVTGTEFNVTSREKNSMVLLVEGELAVKSKRNEILLKPGELIQVNEQGTIEKVMQKPESGSVKQLAWLNKKIIFENSTLKNVAQEINELYGVEVIFQDKSLENRMINGILPNDNLNILLDALEATADFDVEHKGDTVTIRPINDEN